MREKFVKGQQVNKVAKVAALIAGIPKPLGGKLLCQLPSFVIMTAKACVERGSTNTQALCFLQREGERKRGQSSQNNVYEQPELSKKQGDGMKQ